MTSEAAIKKLDAMSIVGGDIKEMHEEADKILLSRLRAVDPEVVLAYTRAKKRCGFWYA